MSAILIGGRGSGKTTIGRKLADRLWQPFLDTDDLIVSAAGRTIAEIFASDGEAAFRDLEERAVRQAIERADHVIALGGGSLIRESSRKAVRASGRRVIYLKCDPVEMHRRITADPSSAAMRPDLTATGGLAEVTRLLAEREPIYRQCMTAELDVTRLTPEEAVVHIARML